jgi:hypothetical protein
MADERLRTPDAILCDWYRRTRYKLVWTRTNRGAGAKRCLEKWNESAKPLPAEPGAAAGFFTTMLVTHNPAIPALANGLVLWDFDRADMDELLEQHGLELPRGAWLVRTPGGGTHAYTTAPAGRPGMKVEVTTERVSVSTDGYLIGPGGLHPNGDRYELLNVDLGSAS